MSWLGQLFSRQRRYDEVSESIREHLDEKVADLIDGGMTREQAERVARRQFGNVTRIKEQSREVWQWPKLGWLPAVPSLDLRWPFQRCIWQQVFCLACHHKIPSQLPWLPAFSF